jgi:DNA-binding winged helix-turn-helix (wHTH) protein
MAPATDQTVKNLYKFGPFRLDPRKELLLRGDEAAPLTHKAFRFSSALGRAETDSFAPVPESLP